MQLAPVSPTYISLRNKKEYTDVFANKIMTILGENFKKNFLIV